jgi:cysteine desulfurase / selenocysteine lyase
MVFMHFWRRQFPFIRHNVVGAYLDSAASCQKPDSVLAAMDRFYRQSYGNTHRGVHRATERATAAFEAARATVAGFIGASPESVVMTHGATNGLNIAAYAFAEAFLKPKDVVLSSVLEHHSSFLPWQRAAKVKGATLKLLPLTASGELDLQAFHEALKAGGVKIVALSHASNVLGSVLPIGEIVSAAHASGAYVIVDGSQIVAHRPVNVVELGVDAYAFSAHKLYGPTGIGALYLNSAFSDKLPPFELGGGMVGRVELDQTTFAPVPYRFEAGTPPIAEAVGFAEAVRFVQKIGFARLRAHEEALLSYMLTALRAIPGLTLYGDPADRVGVVAFNLDGIHPHDAGTLLDAQGVAVRVGHHCAQPLMDALGIPACMRASLGAYNTSTDIDCLIRALKFTQKKLG